MNISKQYNVYIISGKVYLYYDEIEFTNNIIFEKKNNLIRIGYDKTTSISDEYLIDINTKTRDSTLKTYPHILLTLNIHTHDKNNNYNKNYPYYGKNTTIIDKKEKFINNKNIYPKYFKLNDNIKYVINTQIKYNCDTNMITDSFLAEIYSIIFHLRVNIIEKEFGKDFDDYFDESNKIESIEYNFGESLFHNGYYGPTKRTIKLYDEENDTEYNDVDDVDNDDNVDDSEENSIDNEEFIPDIIKLNVKLTNKILELEQKINIMTTNINNKNNNIEYKINKNNNMIKYYKNIFYIYFIFFVIMIIWINFY